MYELLNDQQSVIVGIIADLPHLTYQFIVINQLVNHGE